jgi:hypothetical protein
MSEEKKEETTATTTEQAAAEPAAKKKKWPIVVGVIVAVIVVAGIGFWNWHEQPSFCNAFCHESMDSYVATWDQDANTTGVDKWGNEVSNTNAMLVVAHKQAGVNCLQCHVPTLSQQLSEVSETITGDYYVPLAEVGTEDLMVNSGHEEGTGDQFCLKSGCHDLTRADLTELTSDMPRNPHSWQHGEQECSDCHKSHRASVLICTECHSDAEAELPDGWVDAATGDQLEKQAMSE